jgi:hypothetical protein
MKVRKIAVMLTFFLAVQITPSEAASKPKVNNLKLACAAWKKGDNKQFAKYLVRLQMQGSKYSQFVKVGFEDMKVHQTDPSKGGTDAYQMFQNAGERQRILSAYCS